MFDLLMVDILFILIRRKTTIYPCNSPIVGVLFLYIAPVVKQLAGQGGGWLIG